MVEQGEGTGQQGGSGPGGSSSATRTLEIGFFFDGTLNNLANAGGRGEGSYANALSNVALLSQIYSSRPGQNDDGSERRRQSVYLEGIGTRSGGPDDTEDMALGTGHTGVSARVHAACRRLEQETRSGRYAEILVDAFGFSRGAAAARYFVNCVNRRAFEPVSTGFLMDDEPLHLGRVRLPAATVRFVGVFDTVAAIGSRRDHLDTSDADNADVNVHLDDSSAQAICHFVAGNEYRRNFALNSILSPGGHPPAGGVEIVLPGAHSDVGGGYRVQGETVVPVEPALGSFRTQEGALASRNDLLERLSEFAQRMQHEHFAGTTVPEFHLSLDDMSEHPNDVARQPYHYDGIAIWQRGAIRPGLEKIALKLMHERARRHGVPFNAIPHNANYAIPSGIQYIYDILHAGRDLSQMDLALLRMNYVHWSCHYGRADGSTREPFRHPPTYPFYPHVPAPNWRRIIHRNRPSQAW